MLGGPAGTKGFPYDLGEMVPLESACGPLADELKKMINKEEKMLPLKFDRLFELGIIVNRSCNLSCKYCYYEGEKLLPIGTAEHVPNLPKLVNWLVEENPCIVNIIGREPLLSFDTVTGILEVTNKRGIKTGIISNGTFLHSHLDSLEQYTLPYIDLTYHMDQVEQNELVLKNLDNNRSANVPFTINCGLVLLKNNHAWLQASLEKLLNHGAKNFYINLYVDALNKPDFKMDLEAVVRGIELVEKTIASSSHDMKVVIDVWGQNTPCMEELFTLGIFNVADLHIHDHILYIPHPTFPNLRFRFLIQLPCFGYLDQDGFFYQYLDDAIYGRRTQALHKIETRQDVSLALKKNFSSHSPMATNLAAATLSPCRHKDCFPLCFGFNPDCNKTLCREKNKNLVIQQHWQHKAGNHNHEEAELRI